MWRAKCGESYRFSPRVRVAAAAGSLQQLVGGRAPVREDQGIADTFCHIVLGGQV